MYVFNWSESNLLGRGDVAPERGLAGDLMPENAELAMMAKSDGTGGEACLLSVVGRGCCCALFVVLVHGTSSVSLTRLPYIPTTKPRSVMSTITFPGQPSSSSPHDVLYPLSFDSVSHNGFQMNPESAHPPRTPRTSATTTVPFSSQASAEDEGTEDGPTELEIEVEEEENSQEKSAAKNQVHTQEIWRELLGTSTGRDKAFVLHFASPAAIPLLIV
jgi:hypothetical protein